MHEHLGVTLSRLTRAYRNLIQRVIFTMNIVTSLYVVSNSVICCILKYYAVNITFRGILKFTCDVSTCNDVSVSSMS